MNKLLIGVVFFYFTFTHAALTTNAVKIENPPSYLNERRVEKVTEKVERWLEWPIKRVSVYFYSDSESFHKVHGKDDSVYALTKKSDQSIHIGPRVNTKNFDSIFAHELTHVIVFQKYKDSIPPWLEEGLANFISKSAQVDYKWLSQKKDFDILSLTHAFQSIGTDSVKLHYEASTAFMEMLNARCHLRDLMQISVGSRLENYIKNICGLEDINSELKKWIALQALKGEQVK